MAKVQIKSEKLTPFGGIFSGLPEFGVMASKRVHVPFKF